jgi:hypothetical protein
VSSIQYLGYTFICNGTDDSRCGSGDAPREDCKPKNINNNQRPGCCDNVRPFAVYSPLEFAYLKTGDCDTKALFAFTILKGLGYNNVSVIYGDVKGGGHAMLGVKIPNPSTSGHFIRDYDGQKIYAWETTGNSWRLGQRIWNPWKNWKIGIK